MKLFVGWRILLIFCIMTAAFIPSEDSHVSAGNTNVWWHDDWPYRVQVSVNSSGPISANLNFTQLFSELGLQDALLDIDSLRVVPYKDGLPEPPVPFEETYTTLFLDADTLNTDTTLPDPYWKEETDWTLSLDNSQHTQGTGSVHAHMKIRDFSPAKTGFNYHFNGPAGMDWSIYDLLLYDIWPQVNDSAIDQTPDVFFFELGGLGLCPMSEINGPALIMETWNTAVVSLKPFGNCPSPDLSALEYLRFFMKVSRPIENHGYYETGDELDLWLDNFRLLDQDGSGEIRWESETTFDSYYIYFDTINHAGHPKPNLTTIPGPALSVNPESPESGGYFHNVTNADTGDLSIWAAPIGEKIPQAAKKPVTTKPISIFGAKGEFEPIQVVVNAPTTQSLTLSASPLTHENAIDIITTEQIDFFRVDYVEIAFLSDFYGRATNWPDPLYPVSLGDSVTFTAGVNQPLWIRVHIPSSASPGTYTGIITIGSASIPFSITVWDFVLHPGQHLENQIGFNWNAVMDTYGGTISGVPQPCYAQLEAAITETLTDYKITVNNEEVFPDDVAVYSLTAYEVNKAHDQQLLEGKHVWMEYTFFDHPPHINPAVMDRPGVESRLLPWLAWLDRVDGLYYPQSADWDPDPWSNSFSNDSSNGDGFYFYPPNDTSLGFDPCIAKSNRLVPSIRLELLREGLEDYTYLQLLNRGKPLIGQANSGDLLARLVVDSRTSINRIPTAIDPIRQAIAVQIAEQQHKYFLPLLIR